MKYSSGFKSSTRLTTLLLNSSCRRYASVLFLAAIVICFAACSKRYHNMPAFSAMPLGDAYNNSVGRFKTSYLADQVHAYYRGNIAGPIAVTTFVDIDNLYSSSTFGRMVAEQLMSELTMKGYNVIELRLGEALQVMQGEGEFVLSHETPILKNSQQISGLVVGTYVVSPVRVYLNARLIDPKTSLVVSAGSVEMDKTSELATLLRINSIPQSLERIPVKHFGYATVPNPMLAWPVYPTTQPDWRQYYQEERVVPPAKKDNSADTQAPPAVGNSVVPPVPTL